MSRNYFSNLIIIFLFQLSICSIASAEDISDKKQKLKEFEISESQILLSLKYYSLYKNLNFDQSKPNSYKQNQSEETSEKSPWLAFGLSYLFPGLGQLYNGEYLKAVLFPTFFCIGAGLMVMSSPGADFEGQKVGPTLYPGIVLAGGSYLWSLIDAPVSANRINDERITQKGMKIISSKNGKYALSIKNEIYNNNFKLEFSVDY